MTTAPSIQGSNAPIKASAGDGTGGQVKSASRNSLAMRQAPVRIGIVFESLPSKDVNGLRYLLTYLNSVQTSVEFQMVPPVLAGCRLLTLLTGNPTLEREMIRSELKPAADYFTRLYCDAASAHRLLDDVAPSHFIVISDARFVDNYFTCRGEGCSVLARGSWKHERGAPTRAESLITLIVREAGAAAVPDMRRSVHFGTKGCLFDFDLDPSDAVLRIRAGFVCQDCRSRLDQGGWPSLATDLQTLADRSWWLSGMSPETRRQVGGALSGRPTRSRNVFVALGLATFACVVAIVAISVWVTPDSKSILYEVEKTLMQIVTVAVIGGAIAFAFDGLQKQRESERTGSERLREERNEALQRERDRLLAEQQRSRDIEAEVRSQRDIVLNDLLNEIIESYNKAKKVRRDVRAHLGNATNLAAFGVARYDESAGTLNEIQLSFESLKTRVRALDDPRLDRADASLKLANIESYLNDVIREWETNRQEVAKAPGEVPVDSLSKLNSFTSDEKASGTFIEEVSANFHDVVKAVQDAVVSPQDGIAAAPKEARPA